MEANTLQENKLQPMNPEWKEKWCTALESGDYSQIQDKLRSGESGYCCLGVLCDLVKDEVGARFNDLDGAFVLENGNSFLITPPGKVFDFVGLKERQMSSKTDQVTVETILMIMNDKRNKSFTEIAQWIRENL
ncbi:hypothetical protein UFOVP434_92 [uncultured Caudovirales phage]|uniref:Uncharacterized protein n=1 Tax=uncultured Caudovirales phage TaxID=2100421 RepID=A0A6J5MBQ6_9CAUD|nr:hypothetical protein UFOVP434_92 [uncultured Caudovirales phage]